MPDPTSDKPAPIIYATAYVTLYGQSHDLGGSAGVMVGPPTVEELKDVVWYTYTDQFLLITTYTNNIRKLHSYAIQEVKYWEVEVPVIEGDNTIKTQPGDDLLKRYGFGG